MAAPREPARLMRVASCGSRLKRSRPWAARAFAERARRELLATGEKVRKRNEDTRADLTPQGGGNRPAGPGRTNQPGDRRADVHRWRARWSGTCAKCSPSSISAHPRARRGHEPAPDPRRGQDGAEVTTRAPARVCTGPELPPPGPPWIPEIRPPRKRRVWKEAARWKESMTVHAPLNSTASRDRSASRGAALTASGPAAAGVCPPGPADRLEQARIGPTAGSSGVPRSWLGSPRDGSPGPSGTGGLFGAS